MGSSGDRMFRSPSLAVRMVIVGVLTPLTALVLLAAVVVALPQRYLAGLGVALGVGVLIRVCAHTWRPAPKGVALSEREDPELFVALDRLCQLADVARPEVVLSEQRQPNSWVVHLPGRAPRLYLTTALRDLLTLDELQAVLGHELAHVVNRDALVMSVVGMPGSIMLNARAGGLDGLLAMLIGAISQLGTSLLSRHRELAADAGSAAITGRPSALASALLKVSDALERVPTTDLRSAAALNAFNLVAVTRRHRWWHDIRPLGRALATHPPLAHRVDALAEIDRRQQTRRV